MMHEKNCVIWSIKFKIQAQTNRMWPFLKFKNKKNVENDAINRKIKKIRYK